MLGFHSGQTDTLLWWQGSGKLLGKQRKTYIRQKGCIAFSKLSCVQAHSMTHSY